MMVGFERPLALLGLVLVAPILYSAFRRDDRFKQLTSLLHALLVTLLVLALAAPVVTVEARVHDQPQLTVLADESMSTSIMEPVDLQLDNVRVNRRVIGAGNTSDLKQALLQRLEPNTNYVAISDFQSEGSLDGVAKRFNAVNSTLNAIRPDSAEEAAVRVEGPDTTVPGAETQFTVHVSSTGEVPEPQVRMDGERVSLTEQGDDTWTFTRSFASEGVHRITAEIPVDDRYELNDRYYKAVEVAEKPEVLVVGERGGLGAELERFYDVTYRSTVPDNVEDYYAVVLKKDVDGLERYALRGNGVVYTGDPGEAAPDVLPVRVAPAADQTRGTKIVLAVDISVSTAEEGKVKQSKRIAYNLVELLPFNNRAGAIAYNRHAFLVADPKPLTLNRETLKDRIARL
ncbi:MAG: hypothetical protein SVW02_02645, partial [Candidatus Nanohaloarchaea archaeon]|nr:hypothetical protein [Candidatus Nanohaloarchaea archaeon]